MKRQIRLTGTGTPDEAPEKWKAISGFDGRYEVSDKGNVRSFCVKGSTRVNWGDPTSMTIIDNRHGYKLVKIRVGGHVKSFYVHRLVAEAFIPNPNNYKEINHKDEDKANNCAENLEWCTHKYNQNYGTMRKRQSNSHAGKVPRSGWHWSEEDKKRLSMAHTGKKMSEETKEKLRQLNLGEKNHFYGHHLSEEAKEKIRAKKIGRFTGEKNPMYGKNAYAGKTPEEMRAIAEKKREAFRKKREQKQKENQNEE